MVTQSTELDGPAAPVSAESWAILREQRNWLLMTVKDGPVGRSNRVEERHSPARSESSQGALLSPRPL